MRLTMASDAGMLKNNEWIVKQANQKNLSNVLSHQNNQSISVMVDNKGGLWPKGVSS